MRRLCTILARGGSKGVPGKNIRRLAGKPLIAHSIEQALASGLFEAIAVSSDDEAILRAGEAAGADELVVRPPELASDKAAKLPGIHHCVEEVERRRGLHFDVIADLQPTSPLRLAGDIQGAVALLEESGAPNVITGAPAKCSPYFSLVEEQGDGTVGLSKPVDPPFVRRQDAPRTFDMNGSIYVWRREALFESDRLFKTGTRLYEMPEARSVDIDTELDFAFAEFLLAQA
ncbi:cytidylyltransferase domain-containing protein [Tepidicaulis sp. LMO-SS28]|uniref:acylneuraminate cytidylyltransferase family protein n=1 Tax=Tepidicaulis sp. LMO-SS28 TaxID=3447455 RepID=UPI003EE2F123